MRLTSLLSATLLIAAAVASTPARSLAQSSSAEAGVHHWLDAFTHAFESKDTKAIHALYTPDVIAFDVVPPLQSSGLDAYDKDWSAFFAQYKGPLHLEYRNLHIYTSGGLALITCLEQVSGTLTNGQQSSVWLRDTTALRHINGRWLDFHDHVSVPADMNTGKARLDLQP